MKRYQIHIEDIKKAGAKHSFQIKLPITASEVNGILITVNPKFQIPFSEVRSPQTMELGAIWLRLSGGRDVFYSETVQYPDIYNTTYSRIQKIGFVGREEWWFTGSKQALFNVTIPVNGSVVEGFYKDQSEQGSRVDYEVRVYLELKYND